MLQILSLYFALPYCFTKKELIFSKLRWRSSKRSSSVSILTSFEDEFPLGFATSKKALPCHFFILQFN